jgi:hypothetical protein
MLKISGRRVLQLFHGYTTPPCDQVSIDILGKI